MRAQGFFVAGEGTYSTYSMKELKEFQESAAASTGLGLKTVTNFPAYFGWGINAGYRFSEEHQVGLSLRYHSTGARSGNKDYSGEVTLDQLAQCYSIGIFENRRLFYFKKLDGYVGINLYYVKTTDELVSTVTIGSNTESDAAMFKANGIGLVPSLRLEYQLPARLFLYTSAGYELQWLGEMKYEGQKTDIHARWDGLRLAVGLGIRISEIKSAY